MKKFIALLALVLVSASTMMYAQESNAAKPAPRGEKNQKRRGKENPLRKKQVQDMAPESGGLINKPYRL